MSFKIPLKRLLANLVDCNIELPVTGLALDSRQVKQGMIFLAVAGHQQHGLAYAQQAIQQGAAAIIYEPMGSDGLLPVNSVPLIALENLSAHLGLIASRFYQYPNQYLDLIAITGTNGKTSCSLFLSQAMADYGVIGTLGWGTWNQLQATENTTPDALSLQAMLAGLHQLKKNAVAIEVSSHALVQQRVNHLTFKGVIFTNISRDHLDYHQPMQAYIDAKLSLLKFEGLEFCVVNLDDAYSSEVIAQLAESINCWGYSRLNQFNHQITECVLATEIKQTADGSQLTLRWRQYQATINCALFGDFNIENILAVFSCLLAMGVDFSVAAQKMTLLAAINGRMQHFGGDKQASIFVDYAHTPDALANVLKTLKKHCSQRLWLVFGCGGNRDRGKRALMGEVAAQWADNIIITDDNPRDENPESIVTDILSTGFLQNTLVIHQRSEAIAFAIKQAEQGDMVLIAGKGHEDYQEINGVRRVFCDGQIVAQCLKDNDVIK